MDRRAFITVVGGSILTAPFAGEAHQGVGPTKIGVLASASEKTSAAGWASFRQGLRDLGWKTDEISSSKPGSRTGSSIGYAASLRSCSISTFASS